MILIKTRGKGWNTYTFLISQTFKKGFFFFKSTMSSPPALFFWLHAVSVVSVTGHFQIWCFQKQHWHIIKHYFSTVICDGLERHCHCLICYAHGSRWCNTDHTPVKWKAKLLSMKCLSPAACHCHCLWCTETQILKGPQRIFVIRQMSLLIRSAKCNKTF